MWGTPEAVRAQARQLTRLLPAFFPHVLVGQQLSFAPILIAEALGIPLAIRASPPIYFLLSRCACPSGESPIDELRTWRQEEMYRYFNSARNCSDIHPDRREQNPFLGDLFLLQTVEALEGSTEWLPPKVQLVGSCLWEPPERDPELECWLTRAAALKDQRIYLQLGTAFRGPSSWPLLVEHLSHSPVQVVASTGRMIGSVGALPANFLASEHTSQGQVLPHVDAVISRATTTAVLGALTHGLPSLLIPSGGEQPDLAERCEAAGAALSIDAEVLSSESLDVALRRLFLDTRLRENAERLRDEFARAGGCCRAAELLESLGQMRASAAAPSARG